MNGSPATSEDCMTEAAYCLDEADRSDNTEAKALCLGVAALWHELAMLRARLDPAGTA
jgi:hypothetical protein